MRYNPPPNWPAPPQGWTPPPGWQPDPSWPPPPQGWQLWVDDQTPHHATPPPSGGLPTWVKVGGAVLGVLLVVGVIGALVSPDDPDTSNQVAADVADEPTTEPAETKRAKPTTTEAAPEGPGIGDKVRDGKFEFTVLKVQPGVRKVGGEFFEEKAQGQFVLVTIRVRNIGDEAQTFTDSAQAAFDAKGREYAADTEAAIYLEDNDVFLEEINPGNKVTGVVVFDVPKATKLTRLELHDSIFSGGVEVALR